MRIALALLLAVPLAAQTPRYQEELTVAEVTLEINVTDRDGQPVTGLTAADLEVFEDGKAVAITFFREFDASAATRPAPSGTAGPDDGSVAEPRTAFIFLDNAEIGQSVRARLFDSLRTSVAGMMNGGVEIVFLLWTDQLLLIKPADVETATGVLASWKADEDLVRRGIAGNRSRFGTLAFDDADYGLARAVRSNKSYNLFAAVSAALRIAAKAPGRRIMVIASRGLSIPVPSALETMAEEVARQSLGDHPLAGGRLDGSLHAPEILIPTHGDGAVGGTSLEDSLSAIANRYGIPIYGMFSGGLEAAARAAAIESGRLPKPFAAPRSLGQLSREVGSLTDIAGRTGGVAAGATSVFAPFLESVASDLDHFYAIAYRSAPELRFRKLEVRPRNREWTVRHRKAAVPDDQPLSH